jgi:hypothetical protein
MGMRACPGPRGSDGAGYLAAYRDIAEPNATCEDLPRAVDDPELAPNRQQPLGIHPP